MRLARGGYDGRAAATSTQSPRTSAQLAKPPRASGCACEQVASPESDGHSLPYLVTSHVLAPGDRKLFSADVSIESHVLGEGIKRESPSPLLGCL